VVEVRRGGGGILPSALLGGEISAITDDSYVLRVAQSTDMTLGAPQTCVSRFWGSLVPGLPEEFALPALEGAGRVPKEPGVGVMVSIDRGRMMRSILHPWPSGSPVRFGRGRVPFVALLEPARSSLRQAGIRSCQSSVRCVVRSTRTDPRYRRQRQPVIGRVSHRRHVACPRRFGGSVP
jgi:hypothetical protein